ncbi:Replication factor-A carboxy-terminal domain protein [Arachis hypogaea]|nr:Replication factor-A carboxy-terminal domain protein [Arachis hypogaea]
MSLTIDPLKKISPWKEAWRIKAKILTIWEDVRIVNENMEKLLHMVLMDKQHHKIQVTVGDDLITTFIHQLKEGDVFIIFDFKVIPNGGLVRVTRYRFRILFKCSTSFVATASTVIPNPGLSLTSMDQILQKCSDYEYLIDFVGVLCGLKRKKDVECNGKILKVMILEVFADGKKISCNFVGDCPALIDMNTLKRYGIARHHFSRLHSNKVGDLVCVIDDESFDWKLIQTIDNLKENNEDGQFFVVGKIKEIVEDPEWWIFSSVCGHPIVGDDNVFHCQLCSREVQHFMISYKIKILVEDGTSCGMFVLLDSATTKLLGRTCSDVFLLLEDKTDFFHKLLGKEIVFKVQAKRIRTQGYCGTFKVINVISDACFFNKLQADQSYDNQVISGVPIQFHSIKEMLADILCAKIYSSDQICFLIGEIIDVLKHQKWWYYCCLYNAPVCYIGNVFYYYPCRVECVNAIRRYRIKIIVSHSNGSNIFILEDDEVAQILKKSCSDFLIEERNSSQSKDDYTVPDNMISQLMNKKIVFIVDPRPVGYELNTSLHVVHAICDDIDIMKFLEDSDERIICTLFGIAFSIFWLKLRDLSKNLIQRLKRTADAVGF